MANHKRKKAKYARAGHMCGMKFGKFNHAPMKYRMKFSLLRKLILASVSDN